MIAVERKFLIKLKKWFLEGAALAAFLIGFLLIIIIVIFVFGRIYLLLFPEIAGL